MLSSTNCQVVAPRTSPLLCLTSTSDLYEQISIRKLGVGFIASSVAMITELVARSSIYTFCKGHLLCEYALLNLSIYQICSQKQPVMKQSSKEVKIAKDTHMKTHTHYLGKGCNNEGSPWSRICNQYHTAEFSRTNIFPL